MELLMHQAKIERGHLFTQLVTILTDCEPPEENFEIALEYCLYHTSYHKYVDATSPAQVMESYNSLMERMRVNGQFHKADSLKDLTEVAFDLYELSYSKSNTLEVPTRILHLLLALSEKPLDSEIDRTHVEDVAAHATNFLTLLDVEERKVNSESDSDADFGGIGGGGFASASDDSDWDEDIEGLVSSAPQSTPANPAQQGLLQADSADLQLVSARDTATEVATPPSASEDEDVMALVLPEEEGPGFLGEVFSSRRSELPWVGLGSCVKASEAMLVRAGLLALQV
ncbi:hypothetical protein CYMTET_30736 [Cymbomonas tetramitiformis]|uniref:Uncharacterized protein n=1 Tax=Cymbomonas tetramitiformis TaxID=36881 RepID=A0AAE0KTN0_9CHLO|nr:hypothetical protein CYMTET_30736 [Cymbomonas tetramitiformis]